MPVALSHMRDILLPGMMEIAYSYRMMPLQYSFTATETVGVNILPEVALPLPAALALGAAAVIIKNPVVSRRFLPWGTSE